MNNYEHLPTKMYAYGPGVGWLFDLLNSERKAHSSEEDIFREFAKNICQCCLRITMLA